MMHEFLSFNGEIKRIGDAAIAASSNAALYGRGVFTTLAVFRGELFLWDLHRERLRENAARVNLDLSEVDFDRLEINLRELLAANRVTRGRARVTAFDVRSSSLWQFQTLEKTAVLITTAAPRGTRRNDLRLTDSPFPVNSLSPLAGVKSCNYLENLLALEAARARRFDEAVRLNERGEIVSAATANLFWTRGGQIFTPAVSTGALAGTTRQFILEAARKNLFEIFEAVSSLDDLRTADEIFLTSAGLGVGSVHEFDGRKLSNDLTGKIREIFEQAVK